MREIRTCGDGEALPSNGPLTFEGKAGNDEGPELQNLTGETACISDIFSQVNKINNLHEYLIIYPGVTEVRNDSKRSGGCSKAGKKEPITDFSDKSRRSLMIMLAKLEEPMKFWQDFTFSDDVMEGKEINQRVKYSSWCLKEWKRSLEKEGLVVHGFWKREWVERKSGSLKGQRVPHFHLVYILQGVAREDYLCVALKIAKMWVKITGTRNELQALSVALHPKSYRFIESRKQMQKYMSKYIVKNEGFKALESIGRSWGRIGSPKMAEGEVIEVTEFEMVKLKRPFRKMVRRRRGWFKIALANPRTKFFILAQGKEIIRYIKWLRVNFNYDDLPF